MTPEQKQYVEAHKQNTSLFRRIFPRPMMRGSEEYKRWRGLFMPTPTLPNKCQQETQQNNWANMEMQEFIIDPKTNNVVRSPKSAALLMKTRTR